MVEVGSVWVKLGVKSTLGKDLGKATTQLKNFGASARKVSESVTQLGKDLTFKLAAPLALLSGVALKSAANIEQYSIAFENLFGSAKKAGDEIVYILDFAKRTPFQITGLVAADKRLAAFGINAMDVLGTLGDTAAALGVPLMQSVEAFADAQTGEFERVKEFGIKALEVTNSNYQALGVGAEAAGQTALTFTDKYGNQRVELVDRNNREIVSSTLLSIWNSKYAGAMEMQSKSLAGIASNIKDNFTIAGLSIMGFNQQTGQFTDDSLFMSIKLVSEAARSLSESFTELSPTTQKLIVGITGLGIAIPTIILGVGLLSGAFATGATIISGAMVPALGAIIPLATTVGLPLIALGGILYGLEKKFSLVSDTLTITKEAFKVVGKLISEKITAAFERMQPRLDWARESLENLMEGMIELSGPVGTGLKEFLDDWHQRAEDIRKKNEELAQSNRMVADSTKVEAQSFNELGEAISGVSAEIPGYAGHTRELIEAGMPEQAGFADGARGNVMLPGFQAEQPTMDFRQFATMGQQPFMGLDLSAVQPPAKTEENKKIEENTKDTVTEIKELGNLETALFGNLEKAVRESKPKSTGFSGFFRSSPT